MKQRSKWIGLSVGLAVSVAACGDDGGGGTDPDTRICAEGGVASTDSYLPFAVGNIWQYNVIEAEGDPPVIKRQELTEEFTPEGETEPVMVQSTLKSTGLTVSWLRREGELIVRLRQEDYDPDGVLEQTTIYDPPKIRIDERAEHLTVGASWSDVYRRVVTDPTGAELSNLEITDAWTVLGEDVPCSSGWAELSCLHLRNERVDGGVANKEFYFARGYGKVAEVGNQLEELVDCELD